MGPDSPKEPKANMENEVCETKPNKGEKDHRC